MIVAIDGPAGAGKSTVARAVAKRLGMTLVDTGAIYRTVALMSKRRNLDVEHALAAAIEEADIRLEPDIIRLDGEDVSGQIRTPEISSRASLVSAMPQVRAALLELQRRVARAHPVGAVLEGRDIGTVVFPEAEVKVFLHASAEERARRRAKDLHAAGHAETVEQVLAQMAERDNRDSKRPVAPLKPADDAISIDSTQMGLEQVVDHIVDIAKTRSPA